MYELIVGTQIYDPKIIVLYLLWIKYGRMQRVQYA
jgi:hypothetical protein